MLVLGLETSKNRFCVSDIGEDDSGCESERDDHFPVNAPIKPLRLEQTTPTLPSPDMIGEYTEGGSVCTAGEASAAREGDSLSSATQVQKGAADATPCEFHSKNAIVTKKKTGEKGITTYMVYDESKSGPSFETLTRNLDSLHKELVAPRDFVPVHMRDPFSRNGKTYFSSPRAEKSPVRIGRGASLVADSIKSETSLHQGTECLDSPAYEKEQIWHKEGNVVILSRSEACHIESKRRAESPIKVPRITSVKVSKEPLNSTSYDTLEEHESDDFSVRNESHCKGREYHDTKSCKMRMKAS